MIGDADVVDSMRWDEHLVAGTDPERLHFEDQRRGARGETAHVGRADIVGKHPFEALNLGAGAEFKGRQIGAFGNLIAFSFYITTIGGSAIATDSGELAEGIERLGLHGLSVGAWQCFSDTGFKHYEVIRAGYKYNMTDVEASLGLHQLPRLDEWIGRRAELWDRFDIELADLPLTTPAPPEPDTRHARHLYQVLIEPDARLDRDGLLDALNERRIGTGVQCRGVHLHPCYRDRHHLAPADFRVADAISDRTLSVPLVRALRELLVP